MLVLEKLHIRNIRSTLLLLELVSHSSWSQNSSWIDVFVNYWWVFITIVRSLLNRHFWLTFNGIFCLSIKNITIILGQTRWWLLLNLSVIFRSWSFVFRNCTRNVTYVVNSSPRFWWLIYFGIISFNFSEVNNMSSTQSFNLINWI